MNGIRRYIMFLFLMASPGAPTVGDQALSNNLRELDVRDDLKTRGYYANNAGFF